MSEVYFSNSNLLIRSMEVDDAKIIYDTYLSYGWHPSLETSLDKGTQRKTTENELPSLTQCTA